MFCITSYTTLSKISRESILSCCIATRRYIFPSIKRPPQIDKRGHHETDKGEV